MPDDKRFTVNPWPDSYPAVRHAGEMMIAALREGGTIWSLGNGGSAEQAGHFAAELVGRFKAKGRPPLAAISLAANTATITAIANDFGYSAVFSRQVMALVQPGDVVLALSTSGKSENVLLAIDAANSLGAITIGMVAYDFDSTLPNVATLSTLTLVARECGAAGAQEDHLRFIHALAAHIDKAFSQTSEGERHGQSCQEEGAQEAAAARKEAAAAGA